MNGGCETEKDQKQQVGPPCILSWSSHYEARKERDRYSNIRQGNSARIICAYRFNDRVHRCE
jgi:hypothetical protein